MIAEAIAAGHESPVLEGWTIATPVDRMIRVILS
jgi:hypothetical protein